MGEAGPERVTPLSNDSNSTVANNINVNITVHATKEVDVEKMIPMISRRLQSELRRVV